jgi:hypothetical protein
MLFAFGLALLFSTPPIDIVTWIARESAKPRNIEYLEFRADDLVRVFVDRTGDCARGWVRVTISDLKTREVKNVEEFVGGPCSDRPEPMHHFARLLEGLRVSDPATLGSFVPRGHKFSIATDRGGKFKRDTFDHEAAIAVKIPFPFCDLRVVTPVCDAVVPSATTGTATFKCRCEGERVISYALRALAPERDPNQVIIESVSDLGKSR